MRVIESTITPEYHDIEVEFTFLWFFKYREKYRKIELYSKDKVTDRYIMGKTSDTLFREIGLSEFVNAYNAYQSIKRLKP